MIFSEKYKGLACLVQVGSTQERLLIIKEKSLWNILLSNTLHMNHLATEKDHKINFIAPILLHLAILPIIDKLQESKCPFSRTPLNNGRSLFFPAGKNLFKVNSHVKVEANKY
jgi:hypothetical protein